jgi:hypothetical protein
MTFPHSNSDINTFAEPQLDLADLINIEDEPSSQEADVSNKLSNRPAVSPLAEVPAQPAPATSLSPGQSPTSPTGISPFAAAATKTELPSRSSFDLNALWTAPAPKVDAPSIPASPPAPAQEEHKESLLDTDILGQDADDQDFDMFLEKDQDDQNTVASVDASPEAQQAGLDSQPHVWAGKVRW